MADLRSIQRVPFGLLELLGMRGSGINPQEFNGELQGTIDVLQFYSLTSLATAIDGFNTAAQPTATLTVPADVVWLVRQVHVIGRVDGVATTYMRSMLNIDLGGGSLLPIQSDRDYVDFTVALPDNHTVVSSRLFDPPLLLRPGGRIQGQIAQTGGAQADAAVQAVFSVLT